MIFYVAAKFRWRMVALGIAMKLRVHGHVVTSRWLTGHDGLMTPALQAQYAQEDFEDINQVEQFVLCQFPCDEPEQSTGRNVEMGYALAKCKPVIIIGKATSVFHYLPGVTRIESLDAFYQIYCPKNPTQGV